MRYFDISLFSKLVLNHVRCDTQTYITSNTKESSTFAIGAEEELFSETHTVRTDCCSSVTSGSEWNIIPVCLKDVSTACLFRMISKIKHYLSGSMLIPLVSVTFTLTFRPLSRFLFLSVNFCLSQLDDNSFSFVFFSHFKPITVSSMIHARLCAVLMRGLTPRSIQMCWSTRQDPASTSHQVRHPRSSSHVPFPHHHCLYQ